jgi:hypothetical protein
MSSNESNAQNPTFHEDGVNQSQQSASKSAKQPRLAVPEKSFRLITTARGRFEEAMRACSMAGYHGTWTMSVEFRDGKVHEVRFSDNDSVR